jgi:thymidylate kinase
MRTAVGSRAMTRSGLDHRGSFVPHNNKHVRKWYLTAARLGFYFADVNSLRRAIHRLRGEWDIVIFDRYIYDQVANIDSSSRAAHVYRRILLNLAPKPDLAFIVDVSPETAFARKPEYPLAFIRRNRQTFLDLQKLVPNVIAISEGPADQVRRTIQAHVQRAWLTRLSGHNSEAQRPQECSVAKATELL